MSDPSDYQCKWKATDLFHSGIGVLLRYPTAERHHESGVERAKTVKDSSCSAPGGGSCL